MKLRPTVAHHIKKYGLLALYIIPAEIGPRLDSAFDLSTIGIAMPTGFFDIPHPIQSKNKPPAEFIIGSAVWLLRILAIPKVRPITKKSSSNECPIAGRVPEINACDSLRLIV